MHPNRRDTVLGMAATVGLLGFGANYAGADETPAKGDGGTIRLMLNPATTQTFPPGVIVQRGIDKKYGFTLETVPSLTTQTTTVNFQNHAAEIGVYGWNDLSRVKAGGVHVVGIVPFLGWANTLVVPVDSPIHTLEDLKGKKLGLYTRTNLDWVVMRAVAQKNMMVLATAHAVSEGIVRRLSGELARKAAPRVYGASGRTVAPPPKRGQPLAVSRVL